MLGRTPRTIWLFQLLDLWRMVLLTSAVLVTVMSFAVAVKPLADGKLEPLDTLRFMLLAMPPMLEYALPFAALFAATLSYHRMAVDSEVMACAVGGVSYRSLAAPAAVSGLILGGIMLALSHQVIPRFLRSMEELVREDVTRLLVAQIGRGQSVRMGDMLVYAESVDRLDADEKSGAYQRLLLRGVLAVKMDGRGRVDTDVTAAQALVWLFRDDDAASGDPITTVKMKLLDVVAHRPGEGLGQVAEQAFAWEVPGGVIDDPKFLTYTELRRLRDEPERMNGVERRRRVLATHLAERATTDRIEAGLTGPGSARLVDALGQPIMLRGAGIVWRPPKISRWEVLPLAPGRPIEADRVFDGKRVQKLRAERAWLVTSLAPEGDKPVTVNLTFERVRAEGASSEAALRRESGVSGLVQELALGGLTLTDDPVPDLTAENSAALLARAERRVAAFTWDTFVADPARDLRDRLADLHREVTGKLHERAAMAAACAVMLFAGAVMAMRLKDSLPLTVYLWSFIPALVCVLSIVAGRQMVRHYGGLSLPVLWSGVALLGAYALLQYRRLARH
ncbi:MAG: LptF/LptG family permease [Phycisphaerae bacterium]|nr:LptF/LptG family permease [Phycisphaerae bacterium]